MEFDLTGTPNRDNRTLMDFDLVPTPPRADFRSYDALSEDRRMYAILLQEQYDSVNIVVKDNETAVGHAQLKLLGTTNFSVLGTGKLAIL